MKLRFADFREIRLEDRDIIREHLFRHHPMSCEQNYCNMFNWSPAYQYRWTMHDGRLLVRLDGEGSLLFPCGEYFPPETLALIADMLQENGMDGSIFDVPPAYLDAYPDYGRYFAASTTEDSWDYIYAVEKLHSLSGAKLRKKRNHIAQFERAFPRWKELPLNDATVREYESFVARYYDGVSPEQRGEDDYPALETALKFYAFTGLEGLALHNGDQVVAIALFSRQNAETYTIHFEKSDRNIPGASQMVNLRTAAFLRNRCRYLNREQDMGLPGLRHAKRSYDPEFQLRNYTLERNTAKR